jgi:carboxyl-terminal processing protease
VDHAVIHNGGPARTVKRLAIISNIPAEVIAMGQIRQRSMRYIHRSRAFPAVQLLLLCLFLLPGLSLAKPQREQLQYTRIQSLTALDIIERLGRHHYARVPVDDKLSERLLESYIDNLDPGRNIFLRGDIEEFDKLRHQLDDQLLAGDVSAGFAIYQRYRDRIEKRLADVTANLPAMIASFDFAEDEVLVIDRKALDWPKSPEAADEIWRKQLKSSVLGLKLAGKDMPGIEKLLLKRYSEQKRRIAQVNSDDVFQLYMNSFTELFDPHTNYLSPRSSENFNMNMRLSLEGIGAVLQQEDEFTKVARLVPAGPAAKQGELRQSDRIVAVGQESNGELTDVVGWRLDDVVDLIRGPKGSTVRLEVVRGSGANEEHHFISIVRDKVKLEEQAAKSEVLELYYDGALHKIGVIDIPAFYADFEAQQRGDPNYRSTTRDVARLLAELQEQQVEGVIIDLRENGGGSLHEANALTGLFIESGPTVQIRHSNERVERKQKFRDDSYYAGPLLVLINRLSASASEIFAGAIQDYQRGLVVGTQSFGKGTVQSLSALNHGQLKLTESKFYRISGESTQHRGVVPDIELPSLYDTAEVGESALDNALPWDRIAAVRHRSYQDLGSQLATLRERHEARVRHDPDFVYLQGELDLLRQRNAQNTVSLSEEVRIVERQRQREAALQLENARRGAKGMTPLASVDELEDDEQDPESADTQGDAAAPEDSDETDEDMPDILLTESGNILLDAIQLGQRVARSD